MREIRERGGGERKEETMRHRGKIGSKGKIYEEDVEGGIQAGKKRRE